MTQLHRLSTAAVHSGLIRMNRRVLLGFVLGTFLLYFTVYFAPVNLLFEPEFGVSMFLAIETTFACLLLRRFGSNLFGRPYGGLLFRAIFLAHAVTMAIAFVLSIRMLLMNMPLGVYNISATTTLLWGCTIGVSTFAFDYLACVLFVFTMTAPIIYTAQYELQGAEGITLTYFCSLLFFLFLGRVIHAAEIDALVHEETIRNQGVRLKESNDALKASNGLFQDTLESIDEVFLLINLDGFCYSNPCNRAARLLNRIPLQSHITEVLGLNDEASDNAILWFDLLSRERIDFEAAPPQELSIYTNPERGLTYRIRYSPMRAGDKLVSVIMTFTNITDQLRSEKAAEEANARARFVLTVSENRGEFSTFLFEASQFFRDLLDWQDLDLSAFRFKMHTLKGTASVFHLRTIANEINAIEQELNKCVALSTDPTPLIRGAGRRLSQALENFVQRENELLMRLNVFSHSEIRITEVHAELIMRSFAGPGQREAELVLRRLQAQNLERQLRKLPAHIDGLAKRLQKNLHFQLIAPPYHVFYMGHRIADVVDSMIHIFNNAADHGIEAPSLRLALGKPSIGTISAQFARVENELVIRIQDDGGGIDPAKLRAALARKGVDASQWDERRLAMCIFDVGLSTAAEVTEISGQGVGLSAHYAQVKALGGSIEVRTELDGGANSFSAFL